MFFNLFHFRFAEIPKTFVKAVLTLIGLHVSITGVGYFDARVFVLFGTPT
jgi:hypothetical protein